MIKTDFNKNWTVKRIDAKGLEKKIDLPHDAMLSEKRSENNPGIHNIGYFEGGDYQYTKDFFLNEADRNKEFIFEFEGVYHDPEVYINGERKGGCNYGYTDFYVKADNLKYGEENEIKVISKNSDQPNSRWYTGSGIYRPVWLWTSDKEHIEPDGIKVRTVSIDAKDEKHRTGNAQIGVKVAVAAT